MAVTVVGKMEVAMAMAARVGLGLYLTDALSRHDEARVLVRMRGRGVRGAEPRQEAAALPRTHRGRVRGRTRESWMGG